MRSAKVSLRALPWLLVCVAASGQDANITRPVGQLEQLMRASPPVITEAQISRPKISGDITLKADVSFGGAEPIRVKLRHAEPGADSFNNVPRYDLAAYELQKLFLDPEEYVVPPTALRMLSRADVAKYQPLVAPTFKGADQVLCVLQYWLSDTRVIADVYDADRFAADPLYARHIGQLNLLTYLIEHGDSNVGNFLIGRSETGARVFAVDNGVAFASEASDRGAVWQGLRVHVLPADAVQRLRKITPEMLQQRLGVLVQWKLDRGNFVAVPPGANLAPSMGVRLKDDQLQMGLTAVEIREVRRRLESVLKQVSKGRLQLAQPAAP